MSKIDINDVDALNINIPERHTEDREYVKNKELLAVYEEYYLFKKAFLKENPDSRPPPLPEKVCIAIMNIADRLSKKHNFSNYSYRDDMVADGIEVAFKYGHNFNPEKSNNPFAYLTQIVKTAFFRRIESEAKQHYFKLKLFDMKGGVDSYLDDIHSSDKIELEHINEMSDQYDGYLHVIDKFEAMMMKKRTSKKKPPKPDSSSIENFIGDKNK